MPRHSPDEYAYYEELNIQAGDYNAGDDNAATLSAGQIGEIATLEVGEDGSMSSYQIAALGGRKAHEQDNNPAIFVELYDDATTPAVVDDRVQFRWVTRDKNSNRKQPLTQWFTQRDANNGTPGDRPEMLYQGRSNETWVQDGKLVVLEAKREDSSTTVNINNSTVEHKAVAGSR